MLDKFQAFQLALVLYRGLKVRGLVPAERDQLQRSCLSIVLNLAEGSAKPTEKERRRFYGIALASLRETQALLEITQLGPDRIALADRLGAMIYRLARPR